MTAQNIALANLAAATSLARALAASPPRHVVVSPGARSAPLVLAMAQEPGLRLHVVLDERAAAFVALGLALGCGRAAVLVCTSGSAGAHYLPALIEAHHSHVPVVAITADRPAEQQGVGAPQTTAQRDFYAGHAQARWQLPEPSLEAGQGVQAAWGLLGRQALWAAEGGARGPVHLNAPFREPLVPDPSAQAEAPAHAGAAPPQLWGAAAPQPSAEAVAATVAWMRTRSAGAIYAGPQALRPGDTAGAAALVALAARLGWPLLCDALSQLRPPAAPSDEGGTQGAAEAPAAVLHHLEAVLRRGAVPPCDGLLRLGTAPASRPLRAHLGGADGPEAVLVHPHRAWHDPDGRAHALIEADPGALARALLAHPELPPPAPPEHAAAWREADAAAAAHLEVLAADAAAPLWAGTLWPALAGALPPEAALHVGSSMPVRELELYGSAALRRRRISCSRGVNGIDGTLSTAVGLALAGAGPQVVVLGDLTFLHDIGALQAARQLAVPLVVVVCNNGGGDIFRHLPVARYEALLATYFTTPQRADLGALSVAAGAAHRLASRADDLAAALSAACGSQAPGVQVIEASIDAEAAHRAQAAAWQSTP